MDTVKFRQHLDNSMKLLLDVTRQNCYNDIAETLKFIIQPSGTDFHNGLDDFEKKNLIILNKYADKLVTADQVVTLLCHNDKVPLWINTTVYESRADLTIVHLLCSRRLRHDNQLFFKAVTYPPFSVQVPLPPDSLRQDDGKFDINFKKQLDDKLRPKSILTKLKRLLMND